MKRVFARIRFKHKNLDLCGAECYSHSMYYTPASKKHISDERLKARKLKKTRWWLDQVNKGQCYYCEEKVPKEEITMDHKVPIARGGKSTKSNAVPCCKSCNTNKHTSTPVDIILEND